MLEIIRDFEKKISHFNRFDIKINKKIQILNAKKKFKKPFFLNFLNFFLIFLLIFLIIFFLYK